MTDNKIPVTKLVFGQRKTLAQMFGALGTGAFVSGAGSLIVIFARDFGLSQKDFAIVASSFGFMMLLVGVIGKPMIRRFTISEMQIFMAVVAMVGYVGIMVAPGYWLTILATLVAGLGAAISVLLMPVVFRGPDAARGIGLVSGMSSIAAVLSPLCYGLVDKIPGVSGRMAVAIGFLYMAPILVIAGRERQAGDRHGAGATHDDTTPGADEVQDSSAGGAHHPDVAHDSDRQPTRHYIPFSRQPMKVKAFFTAALGRQTIAMFAEYVVYAWAATRLMQEAMDESGASIVAALFPLGMMVARLSAASHANRRGMMQVLSVLLAVGTLGVVLAQSAVTVAVSLFIAGAGVSLMYPISIATITAVPRMDPATATSVAAINSGLTTIIGPQIAAFVGLTWGMGWAFALITATAVVQFFLPGRLR